MARRSYPTPLYISAFEINCRYSSRCLVIFIAKNIALARPRCSPASLAHGSRFSHNAQTNYLFSCLSNSTIAILSSPPT